MARRTVDRAAKKARGRSPMEGGKQPKQYRDEEELRKSARRPGRVVVLEEERAEALSRRCGEHHRIMQRKQPSGCIGPGRGHRIPFW